MFEDDNDYEHLIKLDGCDGFVFKVHNDKLITVGGWNKNHWNYKQGDRVLLLMKDGSSTRYKIDEVEHCYEPNDQYFIKCSFHPRL